MLFNIFYTGISIRSGKSSSIRGVISSRSNYRKTIGKKTKFAHDLQIIQNCVRLFNALEMCSNIEIL